MQQTLLGADTIVGVAPIPVAHPAAGVWKTLAVLQDGSRVEIPISYFEGNSKYGTFAFGLWNDGHVGWRWVESGGGGAVCLAFSLEPGKSVTDGLWVGLVSEPRKNMSPTDPQLCIAGGFKRSGESHPEAADREYESETGLKVGEKFPLNGIAGNSNRAYFVTDLANDQGLHATATLIPWGELEKADDGSRRNMAWSPKADKECPIIFHHWEDMAEKSPDWLAGFPIIRLHKYLRMKEMADEAAKRG